MNISGPTTALVLCAVLVAPSVVASPVQTSMDTPHFFAIRGESTNDTLEGDLVNDTLEFAKALQNASTAEEAINITLEFVTSHDPPRTLCQYWKDKNFMSLTQPVSPNIADSKVEWRLVMATRNDGVLVTYHSFKYAPDDMRCDGDPNGLLRPGRLIDTRTPEPVGAPGEVMRLFDSAPLTN